MTVPKQMDLSDMNLLMIHVNPGVMNKYYRQMNWINIVVPKVIWFEIQDWQVIKSTISIKTNRIIDKVDTDKPELITDAMLKEYKELSQCYALISGCTSTKKS